MSLAIDTDLIQGVLLASGWMDVAGMGRSTWMLMSSSLPAR